MGVPWSLAAKVKRGMRRGFYLAPEVMKLAAAFPEVLFVIMGDHGEGMEALANVKFLGRLDDMNQVYSWISVYLRLLRHDSLSAMVLETLARGRYVVYSKEFPSMLRTCRLPIRPWNGCWIRRSRTWPGPR
jgi:glycosyltransferase involved in cell wall biosynthesis